MQDATYVGDEDDDDEEDMAAAPAPARPLAGPPAAVDATFVGDEDDDEDMAPAPAPAQPLARPHAAVDATFVGDEDDDDEDMAPAPAPAPAQPLARPHAAVDATFVGDEDDDEDDMASAPAPARALAGPPAAVDATFVGDEDDDEEDMAPAPARPVAGPPAAVDATFVGEDDEDDEAPAPVARGAVASFQADATFVGEGDDEPALAARPPSTPGAGGSFQTDATFVGEVDDEPAVAARPPSMPGAGGSFQTDATFVGEVDGLEAGTARGSADPDATRLEEEEPAPLGPAPEAAVTRGGGAGPTPGGEARGDPTDVTRLDEPDAPSALVARPPADADATRLGEEDEGPGPGVPVVLRLGRPPSGRRPAVVPTDGRTLPPPAAPGLPTAAAASAADLEATRLEAPTALAGLGLPDTSFGASPAPAGAAPRLPGEAPTLGDPAAAPRSPTRQLTKKRKKLDGAPGSGAPAGPASTGGAPSAADSWFSPSGKTRAQGTQGDPGAGASAAGGRATGRTRGTLRSIRESEFEKLYAGKYRLLNEIARGGMGVVHRALHVDLNQIVALKVLLAGATATAKARQRFLFEAQAAARLKHPNILPVYDIGADGEELYFTMAFVQGKDLKERRKEFDRDKLLEIMIQVTDAVAFAHQRGIIHRDLKPANIMLTADEVPLVMDFGLAKEIDAAGKEEDLLESELAQTKAGTVLGTPFYMSPEQASGETDAIDVRTDIYTLGVILYQLWTGQLPFASESTPQLILEILQKDPVRPRELDPTIPQDLEAIVLKAMEKSPAARYQSAAALREDLERLRDGLPVSAQRATAGYRLRKWVRRNRARVAAAAALLAVVLASGGWVVYEARARALEAIARAEAGLEALSREQAAAEAAVARLLAGEGGLAERRAEVALLRGRLEADDGLARRLERARGPLEEHVAARPRAAAAAARYDAARAATAGALASLRDLAKVHAELDVADEGLARARALQADALGALARAGVATVESAADLEAGIEAGRAMLDEVATGPGAGALDLPAACEAARAALLAHDAAVRAALFAALRLAPPAGPEARLAQAGVEALGELEREVAQAERRVQGARLADRLLRAARDLAARLRAEPLGGRDAVRSRRLEGAVVARGLVQRAAEADPAAPGLGEARRAASFVHGWMLLGVKAYQVFDVELRDAARFAPDDLAALAAERKKNWEQTQGLRRRIERAGVLQIQIRSGQVEVRGVADDVLQTELATYTRQIDLLERTAGHPYLDDELDALRVSRLASMRARVDELRALIAAQAEEARQRAEAEARQRAEAEARDRDAPAPPPPGD